MMLFVMRLMFTEKIAKLPEFKEEDLIDQAYSEQERSSYKSYTDTVYGYYDKEQSPT